MKTNLKLYGSLVCPYVQRVRFLLEQAKIQYDYQELSLLNKEQQQEWYKTINPSMKVPAIIYDDNKIVVESLVINEFLCEAYFPQALPTDFYERANIRRWICYLSDILNPAFFGILTKIKESKNEEADAAFLKLQENWSFYANNSVLPSGKPFLFGEVLSLADYATLPFLNIHNIISRTILKKDLFQSNDIKTQENLNLLKRYLDNAKEKTEFLAANQKAKVLPTEEKDPVVKDLGMTTPEKMNFDEYVTEHFQRSFFGKK